jgi:biotin carboxylase
MFASAQAYGQPPMNVAHEGGIFTTRTLPPDTQDTQALLKLNAEVIAALGLERGVAHVEYIRAQADRSLYFLEIAARVGGAHISDLLEHARGVNPWSEWARLEIAQRRGKTYRPPKAREGAGGLLVCHSAAGTPDLSAYNAGRLRQINKQHAPG